MEAFRSGPIAGVEIASSDLEWFKRQFYLMMNWAPVTGEPTNECLRELELDRLLPAGIR